MFEGWRGGETELVWRSCEPLPSHLAIQQIFQVSCTIIMCWQHAGEEVKLSWSDGHVSPYPLTWLLNRSFMCWQHAGEEVRLSWSDGHVSPYPLTWLLNRSFMCWQHAGEEVRLSWSDGHVSQWWANTLTWWSPIRHRQYFRPLVEISKYRKFSQKISKRFKPKHRPISDICSKSSSDRNFSQKKIKGF
jgi:hypothetical protein